MGDKVRDNIFRVRMFAGPNGSGKSTICSYIQSQISKDLIGIYINPDDIEKEIQNKGFLDLSSYEIKITANEMMSFFRNSELLKETDLLPELDSLTLIDNKITPPKGTIDSYFASVLADFIRSKLLQLKKSFSFETVMSHRSKVDILRKVQEIGYRTYLYYIATEDPEINISRIDYRVKMGGHSVPKNKIIERYNRSLELLFEAVQATNRAYIFDNSQKGHVWLAEITEGRTLEMKNEIVPAWFKKALLDKYQKNQK